MSDISDKELFEAALSNEPLADPVEATADETVVTDEVGQARDEKGRFAAKAQEDEPAQNEQPITADKQPDSGAQVPSWRLREVNEAREAAERRAQEAEQRATQFERQFAEFQRQMQEQQRANQPQPDWYADPDTAFRQNINPIQDQLKAELQATRNQFSEMLARQSIGDAKIDEIKQWVNTRMDDPALNARVARSNHPWGELAKAYDEHKTLSEIGTDPNAYVQKKLDEALNDPAFLAKAYERARSQASGQQPGNPIVKLPPSLNRATSAASPHDDPGDGSDASIFAHVMRG